MNNGTPPTEQLAEEFRLLETMAIVGEETLQEEWEHPPSTIIELHARLDRMGHSINTARALLWAIKDELPK